MVNSIPGFGLVWKKKLFEANMTRSREEVFSYNTITKLEIGRKFENCSWSAACFFKAGTSSATLSVSGIVPVESDGFTMLVIVGNSVLRQFFISEAGRGSKLHDFFADFFA